MHPGTSRLRSRFWLVVLLFIGLTALPARAQLDLSALENLKARSIGPAGMSGRITALDAVVRNPDVIYAGSASGGLWKSESGGTDWTPIFDDQPVASIGAVAINQQNPDVVWVGTGEGNPRNSETGGNGVYQSRDGGQTWTHLGLENTRSIHRLILHPNDPDVAYAAALGATWGENPERGVYKTSDGGQTWEKILYVDEKTGAADLVMDPQNPDKLLAAMWQYRRWPHFFTSGGPGSGLYVTVDGGKTWEERTAEDGLPKGDLGRIGLAIAPSRPEVVYALIESKKNALYRSEDGGKTWKKINDENIGNRPFYYADVYVDPQNENRVYNLYSVVDVSEDGGKTFETLIPWSKVHPDHHAWWIHPEDPDFIIDGNDGGLAISRDRGETWRFAENLPLAQFYHINVDRATPYHVLGGMQDNGSWRGPAYAWRHGGLRNAYWEEVGFGDGFDVVPDSSNPRYVYAMWQGGNLIRSDLLTGEQTYLKPAPADSVALRFNWNAAIAHDPFDPATVYYGSQFVHKSTDRGETWTVISPDLTTNDPEKQRQLESGGLTYDVTNAENFTTLVTLAPSPHERGVLWAGTDDGNVQLTRDGGQTWTNVRRNLRGVPEGTWVPQIRPSKHDPAAAFVVFDNHRRNDWTPYVYATRDYGRSWTRLADEDDVDGYALAIEQDPVAPNLLFLGTEFGLYVSVDGGTNWAKWTHGYPTVSTMDLAIQPDEHDLVIGTFGRGAYVLDDLRPLRALAQQGTRLLDAPLHVFDAPDATLAVLRQAAGTRFAGDAMFAGENRPFGARITYAIGGSEDENNDAEADTAAADTAAASDNVRIEVLQADGPLIRRIRTFKGPAEPGVHRVAWALDRKGVRFPNEPEPKEKDAAEPEGPPVAPGTYTVRLTRGDHTAETTVRVRPDPRIEVSESERQAIYAMIDRLMERVTTATDAADRLRAARKTTNLIAEHLAARDDEAARAAKQQEKAVRDSIEVLLEQFNGREVQGIRRDPSTVTARLQQAAMYLRSPYDAPDETARRALQQAETRLGAALGAVDTFFRNDWRAYQQAVEAAEVRLFESYEPIRLSSR